MSTRLPLALLTVLGTLGLASSARATDGIRVAGDVIHIAMPATAGIWTLQRHDHDGTKEFLESAVVTIGVTHALKHLVDEERPDGGSQSFPSGHASITAQTAEFVRARYGWRFGGPAYVLAAFVAYSRVEAKKHYTHDVLAGAGIGIASSAIFTRPDRSAEVGVTYDAAFRGVVATARF